MASVPETRRTILRFGAFEMDLDAGELRKSGVRQKLQGQPFQLLEVLVGRAREVVTREQLRGALWPDDTFVDFDHSLNNAIQKLREVLGDSASTPRFIETIPRRGYRFLAEVEVISHPSLTQTPSSHSEQESALASLGRIHRELLATTSAPDLKKLQRRVEVILERNTEHQIEHEARELLDAIQQALGHAEGEAGSANTILRRGPSLSPELAACVFDDANALNRYSGFGSWLTLGSVRGQIILVDHTVEERNGRQIIRIISARKATLAERRAYEKTT